MQFRATSILHSRLQYQEYDQTSEQRLFGYIKDVFSGGGVRRRLPLVYMAVAK